MHELGHAIGLHHEQNRRDRDDHLWIRFDHIDPYYRFASEMERADNIDNYGVPYDYASIMHYGEDVRESTGTVVPSLLDFVVKWALIEYKYSESHCGDSTLVLFP